jgi:hypothetical protein
MSGSVNSRMTLRLRNSGEIACGGFDALGWSPFLDLVNELLKIKAVGFVDVAGRNDGDASGFEPVAIELLPL